MVRNKGIATPMEYVMDAFINLMGDNRENGTVVEVGPTGASTREQVPFLDKKAEISLRLLSQRSAPRFGL
jgi:hypothetical protein